LALLLFVPVLSHAQQPSAPSPIVITGLGQATVPLDGPWQFHLGDDPAWSSPTLDDSAWQQLQAGRPWEAQGHYGYTGFAWYRRHLDVTPATAKDTLAVFLRSVDSACEVFWNGALVGSLGKVPPHPVWYAFSQPVGAFPLGPAQSGVLAVRVWKAPILYFASSPAEGGLISVPQAGSVQAVEALDTAARFRWLKANQFTLAVALLSFVVGLLALLAWLRNRDQTLFLWLALAMFFPTEGFLLFSVPGVPFRWSYGLIGVAIAVNNIALWSLLIFLLGLDDRRRLVLWTKILAVAILALTLVDTVLMLFDWSHPSYGQARLLLEADIASTIPAVLLEFWSLVLVLSALRKRLDLARWMLAISALLTGLLGAVSDVTGLGVRWTHGTLLSRLEAPFFTVANSTLNVRPIVFTLLLLSIVYAVYRYAIDQNRRQSTLEAEFKSAQEIQRILIPETLPSLPGFAVTSAYRPAQEVGGDFFQLIALKPTAWAEGSSLFVLGDVSGKGLKAAMTVALIVGTIRSLAEIFQRPADILEGLNRCLHGRMQQGFATCIILRIDPDGTCAFANAGHLAPFLNHQELELPPALPLGLVPSASYDETAIDLDVDDRLTLYTDGLLEARNAATGELFGFDRVEVLIASRPDARQATEAAVAFGQDDDITVLTITRLATGVESTTSLEAPVLIASTA
jgi:hypothetical protein